MNRHDADSSIDHHTAATVYCNGFPVTAGRDRGGWFCPHCLTHLSDPPGDHVAARTCPCCKGTKGRWQHYELTDAPLSWDHAEDDAQCECGPRFVACLACKGTGELVGLARATLLARGDIDPVQRRGYA